MPALSHNNVQLERSNGSLRAYLPPDSLGAHGALKRALVLIRQILAILHGNFLLGTLAVETGFCRLPFIQSTLSKRNRQVLGWPKSGRLMIHEAYEFHSLKLKQLEL